MKKCVNRSGPRPLDLQSVHVERRDRKSRITKRIELTVRGCHVFRVGESRASDPSALSVPGQGLRPCSQLIRALYGQIKLS
jgi:hypothetical protein